MQGQMEVEEILDQKLWADRNGAELGAAYFPAEALRANELKTYRDCPLEYEDEPTRFWADGWGVVCILIVLGMVSAAVWNWPHH